MEYLLVATGHPVKRCLLQSNNLPKSIPELSLQNWGKFLVPSDRKNRKKGKLVIKIQISQFLKRCWQFLKSILTCSTAPTTNSCSLRSPSLSLFKESPYYLVDLFCSFPPNRDRKNCYLIIVWQIVQKNAYFRAVWKAISITCPSSPLASLQGGLPEDYHWAAGN